MDVPGDGIHGLYRLPDDIDIIIDHARMGPRATIAVKRQAMMHTVAVHVRKVFEAALKTARVRAFVIAVDSACPVQTPQVNESASNTANPATGRYNARAFTVQRCFAMMVQLRAIARN